MVRRSFLQKLVQILAGIIATGLWPRESYANWSAKHFANNSFSMQAQQVFGDHPLIDSDAIMLQLPEIAENGAVVPLTVSSDLSDITRIYIWVEKNPTPLAMEIELDSAIAVYITARIKMAESCPVIVIAEQGERLLRAQQWVKVMQGGCGTG